MLPLSVFSHTKSNINYRLLVDEMALVNSIPTITLVKRKAILLYRKGRINTQAFIHKYKEDGSEKSVFQILAA
jgi:propanediol utilization protein